MVLVVLAACVPPPRPVPVLVGDRGQLSGDAVTLALVGGWASTDPATRAEIVASGPDGLLLLGDATSRGTRTSWTSTLPTLGALQVLPLPGEGERRADRQLRTFHQVFAGYGVEGIGEPTSWQSFVVTTHGHRWRFVVLDTDQGALGTTYLDELSWLPKVLGGGEPVVVVANEAPGSNAVGYAPSAAGDELYGVLRRHVDPTRLALVVSASSRVAELCLPGGRWGEGWLSAWSGDLPEPLRRSVGDRALAPAFDEALVRGFAAVDHELPEQLDAEVTTWAPPRHEVRGWWSLTLAGDGLVLGFHPVGELGGATAARFRWSPDTGWE